MAASLLTAPLARAADAPPKLEALPLDVRSVTVSGVSSGGAMAVQFHFAHSALVRGMAALAAPPYRCAEGSMAHALGRCMKDGAAIPLDALREQAAKLAAAGAIDPLGSLRDARVWAYRGTADPVVHESVAAALERDYAQYVTAPELLRIERDGAGHNFPVAATGASDCGASEAPYLASCGFDAAHALLEHLYGSLAPSSATAGAELREFDQRPYAQASGSVAFDDRGWLYVPSSCAGSNAAARCRLHVVFHGCRQGASFVADRFVRGAGYLEVADANQIVVLFPQLKPSTAPLNPLGCWDWWGYEGEDYATQRGPQIRAVRAMIADLLGSANP